MIRRRLGKEGPLKFSSFVQISDCTKRCTVALQVQLEPLAAYKGILINVQKWPMNQCYKPS